jgi:dipeptidyl aminopeptidase/acylaminoacyl peptidase
MRTYLIALYLAVSTSSFAALAESENIILPTNPLEIDEKAVVNPVSVSDFFLKADIDDASLSPQGDMVVYEKFGKLMIVAQEASAQELFVMDANYLVVNLTWVGNNILMIERRSKTYGSRDFQIIEILFNADANQFETARVSILDKNGYIVDPIIEKPEHILFAKYKFKDGQVYSDVFEVSLFDKKSKFLSNKDKINKRNSGKILLWLANSQHEIQAGVSFEDEIPTVWIQYGKEARFKNVWTSDVKTRFYPRGVSKDESKLWVLSDYKQDKLVAVEFDLINLKFGQVLYSREDVDISNISMDPSGSIPLAVTYLQQGQYQYEFLDPKAKSHFDSLQSTFPQGKIYEMGMSYDQKHHLVLGTTKDHAGTLFNCDVVTIECKKIGVLYPWLENVSLVSPETFSVTMDDEFTVESYLTIPKQKGSNKLPLIVMPHGGPIGIRDNSHFTGDTQWLAYNGYAVLQVNYRGSGGYGKAFKAEGMQQWGRNIEDDIEASLQQALKLYPQLDQHRVCLFGGSYGGYSAIMGIIRSPEKYQCAASFAGVTDLPLLFNRSSVQNNEKLTKALKGIIGDPKDKLTELMAYSPVYLYQKITKPLFIAHGNVDEVVDIEHSWRLRRMLQLADIPHEWLVLENVAHSFKTTDEVKLLYDNLIPFLDKHLKQAEKL